MAEEKKVKKDSTKGGAKKPAATTGKTAGSSAPKKTAASGKEAAGKAGAKAKPKDKAKGKVKGKGKVAAKGKGKGKGKKEEAKMEGYTPKAKPELDGETRRLLAIRKDKRAHKPTFRRQEWFRYKKLGTSWRKPRGCDSKFRRNYKYRPALVHVGYGNPKKVRGLHPSGFEDILVHNVADLAELNPKTQAVRIGHGVGTRKRLDIEKAAEKKGLRILNRGGD